MENICIRCGKPLGKHEKFMYSRIQSGVYICPKCKAVEDKWLQDADAPVKIVREHRLHVADSKINEVTGIYKQMLDYYGNALGFKSLYSKYVGYGGDIIKSLKVYDLSIMNFLCCHLELQGTVPNANNTVGALKAGLDLLNIPTKVYMGYAVDSNITGYRKNILKYMLSEDLAANYSWIETPWCYWSYKGSKAKDSSKKLLSQEIIFGQEELKCII